MGPHICAPPQIVLPKFLILEYRTLMQVCFGSTMESMANLPRCLPKSNALARRWLAMGGD